MYATTIIETSFSKAWERAMLFVAKSPLELKFGGKDEIKKAKDSQVSIILDKNAVQDVLNEQWHPNDPFCKHNTVKAYKKEYKKEFDASTFDYTYRDILEKGFHQCEFSNPDINQIEILKAGLQVQVDEQMGSNRNVAVLFNPAVVHFSNKAIPCFNQILVRWENIGYCSVHTTFRSHDLASAWNANMLALVEFVNNEIAKPCDCKIKYWSEHNYSLHIYEYDLPIVDNIKRIGRNPNLTAKQISYNEIVGS